MKTKTLMYSQTIIIIVLIILLFKCCSENTNSCASLDFENSPHKITDSLANEMEELYKVNQYNIINNSLGIVDYREYWFPLQEVKSFLCYVEQKADSLNYDKNTLGIRVYNAAKTENGKVKSSIFMTGTYGTMINSPNRNENLENSNTIEINKEIGGDTNFNMGDPGTKDFSGSN